MTVVAEKACGWTASCHASLYFNDPSGNHLEIVCHGFAPELPIRAPELARLRWTGTMCTAHTEQNAS